MQWPNFDFLFHIQGFTYPVQSHYLEDVLEITGYVLTPYNQVDDYGQDKMWKTQKQGVRKRKSQIASIVVVCDIFLTCIFYHSIFFPILFVSIVNFSS